MYWNKILKCFVEQQIVKNIVDQIEFASEDQCVDLIKMIADTYNHTRMLTHRGHTLVEIIRKQPILRNMISIMGDTEAEAIIADGTWFQ